MVIKIDTLVPPLGVLLLFVLFLLSLSRRDKATAVGMI